MNSNSLAETACVSKGAFAFCRYSLAALVWIGWLAHAKAVVLAVFVLLALSALLKVQRAPMILLYQHTIERFLPSGTETLDVRAMRFAHTVGAVFGLVCVVFLYFIQERYGWGLTALFALVKTVSAVGICPAYKLYGCMVGGGCCTFARRLRG